MLGIELRKNMNETSRTPAPMLIAIGGFPGSGKSTLAKRLSQELRIPRFGSDFFGRTLLESKELLKDETKAFWLGYEMLFKCAQEQLSRGVSVILDMSFGLDFQWRKLDSIVERSEHVVPIPIIIKVEKSVCENRIQSRYEANPECYDPSSSFMAKRFDDMWEYLESLDRKDIYIVDGMLEIDEVRCLALDIISKGVEAEA